MPARGTPAARTRIQADTNKEIVRLLRLAHQRVIARLAAQPTEYERWALPRLKADIERQLAQFGADGGKVAVQAQDKVWTAGRDLVDKAITATTGGEMVVAQLPAIDERQLSAMRTFLTERIKDIGVAIANKINEQLGLVILGVITPGDAIGAVAKIFGGNRRRAITVVKTELGRAFATAAHERMLAAAERMPGLKKQWRHSGAVEGRPNHEAIDGQVREVHEPFNLGNGVEIMYPRDPAAGPGETINCGCTALPYMDHWVVAAPGAKPLTDEQIRARKSRGRRVAR